jgi:G6PDH family F420-dependent oxidoreductase
VRDDRPKPTQPALDEALSCIGLGRTGLANRGTLEMLKLGYKLMSEEHGPTQLVRNAQRAEQAGFAFAAISDHFFPWLEEQGHAPLAWPVLGALANATRQMGLMTAVTCPTMRYHPAIIAQGAATVGLLANNRFTLGLGSGERLNEHVVGAGWPGKLERHERLSEATDIIQGLLAGNLTNYRGHYFRLESARLFDRPHPKVPIGLAAAGIKGARLAGRKAEALIATEPRSDLVEAFVSSGGNGPRYAEVGLCYAKHEEEARKIAHRYFRWSLAGWPVMAELPDTEAFAAASKHVSPEVVAQDISCGPSAEQHLQAINQYIEAGYDHIILAQIGPEQDEFIDFFERALAPTLHKLKAA